MTDLLSIHNKGPEIISTNFYDSPMAKKGFVYLSWNAGTARLLLPDFLSGSLEEWTALNSKSDTGVLSLKTALDEISKVKFVEITQTKRFIKLLFEDHSECPFQLFLSPGQTDRNLSGACANEQRIFTVWTRAGKQFTLKSRIVLDKL